jgi:hypothetical protein
MTTPTSPADLLADLSRRGITVRPVVGRLGVSPTSTLSDEDRAAIREHRAGLLALLTPVAEPWDQREALRLMFDADTLVERLRVDGRHPDIQAAAAIVSSAYETCDLKAVRFACSEFMVLVRRVADRRT